MGIARSEKRGDKGIANALREKLQETDMVREREKNVNKGREIREKKIGITRKITREIKREIKERE